MKFLKVLANSLLSVIYLAWLLVLLVLTVNINTRADLSELILLAVSLAVVYGLPLLIICAIAFFLPSVFFGKAFPDPLRVAVIPGRQFLRHDLPLPLCLPAEHQVL